MGDKLETLNPPENQQNFEGVPFDQQHSQASGFKRPRCKIEPGLLQQHIAVGVCATNNYKESGPFPMLAAETHIKAESSSSFKATSPSRSPQGPGSSHQRVQNRKGKIMSPIWKPDEMLCLVKAWRAQCEGSIAAATAFGRPKSRALKDREVALFLKANRVDRDAKTAGKKWNNMLQEFRKVNDWERRGVGESYFRLSSYERKMQKLPASFDEGVYNELYFFLGHSTRTAAAPTGLPRPIQGSGSASSSSESTVEMVKRLLPPHSRDDFSGRIDGKLGRVGTVTMTWEEMVTLWAEEEAGAGRVNLESLSFFNADILKFFNDSNDMTTANLEAFEDGPLKGFSVNLFTSGQHLKVVGRKRAFPSSSSTSPLGRRDGKNMGTETSYRMLCPVGEMTMTWEESVYLWAEEEDGTGRVKIESLSFFNADMLTFLDGSKGISIDAFKHEPLQGFSIRSFASEKHLKVFGSKRAFPSSSISPPDVSK